MQSFDYSMRAPPARREQQSSGRSLRRLLPEVDLGGGLRRGRRFVVRILLEAEDLRRDVAREAAPRRVVFLDFLVVAHARDAEAILRAGEFVHQAVELLVGFEI